MNTTSLRLLLFVVMTFTAASGVGEPAEPCQGQWAGAALMANLQDIGLTSGELRLLNGSENPKLRRLLERRLAIAAAEARLHVDQGPIIVARSLPSIVAGVDRAIRLLAEHPLDLKPLEQEQQSDAKLPGLATRNIAVPQENLEYVRSWVSKQPWAKGSR